MQNKKYCFISLLSFFLFCISAYSQDIKQHSGFYNKLKSLPSVLEVNEIRAGKNYELAFEQKDLFYSTMEKWLDMKLNTPEVN